MKVNIIVLSCVFSLFVTASFPGLGAPMELFKTRDFSGDWVMSTSSVGGIGTNSGPGMASTVLRHLSLDPSGHGVDSNGSYTFYRADGSFVHHDDDGGDAIRLTLDDPVHGAGKLVYVDKTAYKTVQVYDFIATRSKNGAINKLYLHLVDSSGVKIVVNGVAERQQEK
jgi:hypothetical protein